MEQETTILNEQEYKNVEYAGFWRRFAAYIIDGFIIAFIQQIMVIPFLAIFGLSFISSSGLDFEELESSDPAALGYLVAIIGAYFSIAILMIVLQWLYFSLMESSKYQGTLGKIALNIKVTNYQGERITFLRATGRYFGKILSGIIFMIGFIMAGITEKKQALHDMIAETLVVKKS